MVIGLLVGYLVEYVRMVAITLHGTTTGLGVLRGFPHGLLHSHRDLGDAVTSLSPLATGGVQWDL